MESGSRNITIHNVADRLQVGGVITRERIYHPQKWKDYRLLNDVTVQLTNGEVILIPSGFTWDLSSVPRLLWFILPPDGDFEIAALIHDYLYQNVLFTRSFSDKQMFAFSNATNKNKVDNLLRFIGVRLFGFIVWNRNKKRNTLIYE